MSSSGSAIRPDWLASMRALSGMMLVWSFTCRTGGQSSMRGWGLSELVTDAVGGRCKRTTICTCYHTFRRVRKWCTPLTLSIWGDGPGWPHTFQHSALSKRMGTKRCVRLSVRVCVCEVMRVKPEDTLASSCHTHLDDASLKHMPAMTVLSVGGHKAQHMVSYTLTSQPHIRP